MREIAREFRFSETSFILSETQVDGAWPVRIFTPEREIPFAGHPTLGTSFVIREYISSGRGMGAQTGRGSLLLSLPAGLIPVTFDDRGLAWMEQLKPRFGARFPAAAAAPAVGLDPGDIDPSLPIQEVSTGLPFIILPVRTMAAVGKARINRAPFLSLTAKTEAKDILLFSRETEKPENQLHIRVFVEYEGIPEDPATGSAAGCLCGYLIEHDAYGKAEIDLRGEQGCEIGRPSLLYLRGRRSENGIRIVVGGGVIPVARGVLL
jgi:trans-2,3-dihydro-3-hydroxyanthranilate isomerase